MRALQLDIADRRTLRDRLWLERCAALLERQRRKFVLIVEGVDQTAIGWGSRQELLGASASSYENSDGAQRSNDSDVSLDRAQAVVSCSQTCVRG